MFDNLNIALFTDTYDEINGVGNTYRHLVDYCLRHKRNLDVFTYTDKKSSMEDLGSVRIFRYRPNIPMPIYSDLIFDLAPLMRSIHAEFKRRTYDIIHTATPGSMGLNAIAAAGRFDIPLIGSYHTAVPEYAGMRVPRALKEPVEKLLWKYVKWYYDHCQVVLAPSEHTKSYLEERLGAEVGIFSRGVDTDLFFPRHRVERDRVSLLYVGRLAVEKGLDVLIELFKDRTDVHLTLVGGGPYRKELQRMLENAEFTGVRTGESLSLAYASADIFVYPSETDTFGNVVLEAMSSGLPVVVTDKWAPKELVTDGETGFVAKDRDDFRVKVEMLISDPALREYMGSNARKAAQGRSWDAVFDKLFTEYLTYSVMT